MDASCRLVTEAGSSALRSIFAVHEAELAERLWSLGPTKPLAVSCGSVHLGECPHRHINLDSLDCICVRLAQERLFFFEGLARFVGAWHLALGFTLLGQMFSPDLLPHAALRVLACAGTGCRQPRSGARHISVDHAAPRLYLGLASRVLLCFAKEVGSGNLWRRGPPRMLIGPTLTLNPHPILRMV